MIQKNYKPLFFVHNGKGRFLAANGKFYKKGKEPIHPVDEIDAQLYIKKGYKTSMLDYTKWRTLYEKHYGK